MAQRFGGIVPCKIDTCRYPTRTFRAKAADYEFPTRTRRSGMCHVCHYASLPKETVKKQRPTNSTAKLDTLAGLESYIAARHAREAAAARRAYRIHTLQEASR